MKINCTITFLLGRFQLKKKRERALMPSKIFPLIFRIAFLLVL